MAARVWYSICLAAGRLMRNTRYTTVHVITTETQVWVSKRRRLYAPLLVAASAPLMRILGTGVIILPVSQWIAREQKLWLELRRQEVRIQPDGTLLMPRIEGRTLASILASTSTSEPDCRAALGLASRALAHLHATGYTHGDAMADNVLVDLEQSAAHWIDFESEHDPHRPLVWRRADDLRALAATCLCSSVSEDNAGMLQTLFSAYGDDDVVTHALRMIVDPSPRSLIFHLGQAPVPLSLRRTLSVVNT